MKAFELDFSFPRYLASREISKGQIGDTEILTPAQWQHKRENPEQKSSDALQEGSAFHCAGLTPDLFEKEYAFLPSKWSDGKVARRDQRVGKYKDWLKERGVRHENVLKQEAFERLQTAKEAMLRHVLIQDLLNDENTLCEATFMWNDRETGVPCKMRADFANKERRIIGDLKYVRSLADRDLWKQLYDNQWLFQDPHYRTGACEAWGEPIDWSKPDTWPSFLFVFVSKDPLPEVRLWELEPALLQHFAERRTTGLQRIKEWGASGEYPTFSEEIETPVTPDWIMA